VHGDVEAGGVGIRMERGVGRRFWFRFDLNVVFPSELSFSLEATQRISFLSVLHRLSRRRWYWCMR
jgi:hypothetical protein